MDSGHRRPTPPNPPPNPPTVRSRLSVAYFQSGTGGHECRALSNPWSSHSTGATLWRAAEWRRGQARAGQEAPTKVYVCLTATSTSHPKRLDTNFTQLICSTYQPLQLNCFGSKCWTPFILIPTDVCIPFRAQRLCWSAAGIALTWR